MGWIDAATITLSVIAGLGSSITAYLALYRAPRKKKERVLRFEENLRRSKCLTVVKDVAPKAGTVLTRERMAENLRSLNQPWGKD